MKFLTVLLFLVTSSIGALAQDFKPEQLVGKWQSVSGKTTLNEEIRPDGTSSAVLTKDGKEVLKCEMKWSLEGNKRHYEYTSSSTPKVPVGKKGVDTLVEVDKDHFVIETAKGKREKYVRVKGE